MSLAGAALMVESRLWSLADKANEALLARHAERATRKDRFVWIIVIAIAVVIVMGLMAAWFLYCQNRGGWPALDMPSWNSGGTWKVYCAK